MSPASHLRTWIRWGMRTSLEAPRENLCHHQNLTTQKTGHKIILGGRMSYLHQQTAVHAHTWCCKARDMAGWIFPGQHYLYWCVMLGCDISSPNGQLWGQWEQTVSCSISEDKRSLHTSGVRTTQWDWDSSWEQVPAWPLGTSKGRSNCWCSLHSSCRAIAACLERVLVYNE